MFRMQKEVRITYKKTNGFDCSGDIPLPQPPANREGVTAVPAPLPLSVLVNTTKKRLEQRRHRPRERTGGLSISLQATWFVFLSSLFLSLSREERR